MDILPLRITGSDFTGSDFTGSDFTDSGLADTGGDERSAERARELGASRADRGRISTLDALRQKIAVLSGTPDRSSVPSQLTPTEVLPLPEVISDLLPQCGISRGTVTGYRGARSLLMAIITAATQAGVQVGIVGMPRLNLAAAVEMGADLRRIAVVPEPGVDRLEVAAVLLDGMDLVVLGMRGEAAPAPARCRVVGGRARQRSSSLLVVDGEWHGLHTRMNAQVLGYRHGPGDADLADAHRGYGRLGGMRLRVSVKGRDSCERSAEIDFMGGRFGEDRVRIVRVSKTRVSGVGSVISAPRAVAN